MDNSLIFRKQAITAILLLSSFALSPVFALSIEHPAEEKAKTRVEDLRQILQNNSLQIPADHKSIYGVTGDLNFDGKEDVVIVSKKGDVCFLLIYFQENKDRSFRKVFEKSDLPESIEPFLGPLGFTGIPEISNNVLKISFEFSGGSGATFYEYKARWDKKDTFRLIGYTYHQIGCTVGEETQCIGEKTDINFSTRKMIRNKKTCQFPANYVIPTLTEVSGQLDEPECELIKK
ncbi:hypothetical protein V2P20_12955 [Methylobacter sp. Wu1]|uniref:hypothetical protein n=1 Tax=Methylobacter sp. Wu1 TaxID=3119359 RepID=UPI002F951BC9